MKDEIPAPAAAPVRVAVIDDHAAVSGLIGAVVEELGGFEAVGSVADAGDVVERMARLKADIAIVDLDLGGSDGMELVPPLRRLSPRPAILIFSGHLRLGVIRRALLLGVEGLVEKTAPLAEFEAALRALAAGRCYYSRAASEQIRRLVAGTGERPRLVRLTRRDRELLQGVAEGNGSKEIAARLGVSVHTVVNHRTRLSRKLGLGGVARLTRYAVSLRLVPCQLNEAPEPL